MDDINSNTITTDNGLMQVKPETSRDEQLAFIDTLREIQGRGNEEIQASTHALGSDVSPSQGGINGPNSYWLGLYQTPQTESRIASLRAAAQSSALNTALNNYLARLQEDYSQAYRKASKRQRNNSGSTTPSTTTKDNVEYESSGSYNVAEDAFTKRKKQDLYYEMLPTIQDLRKKIKGVFSSDYNQREAVNSVLGDALTQYKLGG